MVPSPPLPQPLLPHPVWARAFLPHCAAFLWRDESGSGDLIAAVSQHGRKKKRKNVSSKFLHSGCVAVSSFPRRLLLIFLFVCVYQSSSSGSGWLHFIRSQGHLGQACRRRGRGLIRFTFLNGGCAFCFIYLFIFRKVLLHSQQAFFSLTRKILAAKGSSWLVLEVSDALSLLTRLQPHRRINAAAAAPVN